MRHRTAQETDYQNRGSLCAVGSERIPLETHSVLSAGNSDVSARYRNSGRHCSHRLAGLQAFSRFGKMVVAAIKRSGLMSKHQISNISWREVNWQRPFTLESCGAFSCLGI